MRVPLFFGLAFVLADQRLDGGDFGRAEDARRRERRTGLTASLDKLHDAARGGERGRCQEFVLRDRKVSTSYIQRRLSVGYNKAAFLIEHMENEGVVSSSSQSGKREILVGGGVDRGAFDPGDDDRGAETR